MSQNINENRQPSSSGKSVKRKRKPDPARQKSRKINTILSAVLVGISAVMVVALGINTVNAAKAGTVDNQGSEDSMTTTSTGKSLKNNLYEIGNNLGGSPGRQLGRGHRRGHPYQHLLQGRVH